MASWSDLDIFCPVCLEVFKGPVVLSCSHSFCKACLQKWWTEKVTRECPVCKRRSSKTDPPCNLALKNLCEAFSQELSLGEASVLSEPLCPQHKEKINLFCVDHQQTVCLVCRDSRAHHNHKFMPIDEAGQEYKDQLRKSLKNLRDRLEVFSKVKVKWDQTAEHIKHQGQHTEIIIEKEFDKIWAFLQKEKQTRISALRTEVEQKSRLMEQRIAALSQEILTLSKSIRQTEQELKAQDISFLQNYTAAVSRVEQIPLKSPPQLPSGSLVNVAKHLGNLDFNIWNKMKELVSYTPVVLDPNTANPLLVVSDNLSSVHCIVHNAETIVKELQENAWFLDNPEMFKYLITVIGSEGFNSGTHSWEVDVQNDASWAVGVILETTPRKVENVTGYWEIWFNDGKYIANAPPFAEKVLHFKQPLRRIRVELNWDRGKVSFTDSQTGSHIYTFTHTFKEKVFPFINTVNPNNIKLTPVDFTVQLQQGK